MIINKTNEPLDIIVLAGQSNAEGRGVGDMDCPYIPDSEIIMMNSVDRPYFADTAMLDFRVPESAFILEIAKEDFIRGEHFGCFALNFAKLYKERYLNEGRKLLIVKAAVAGTCFAKGHWGEGNPLSARLLKMTDEALSMNSDNRITAFLWHQGESDAMERPELSLEQRYLTHKNNIAFLMKTLRERYGEIPFIAGDFVKEWRPKFENETEVIIKAIKENLNEYAMTAFVETDGLYSNGIDNGTTDYIHFSRNALYYLGKRYFNKYSEINN